MRYFLDTEFNGFDGALLSIALVPEDGDEFYVTLACTDPLHPWVERNVIPFLDHVPVGLVSPRMGRREAADALSAYLAPDPEPEMVADWPEDFTQFCSLLMTGPGEMVPVAAADAPPDAAATALAPPPTAPSRTMRCTTPARSANIILQPLGLGRVFRSKAAHGSLFVRRPGLRSPAPTARSTGRPRTRCWSPTCTSKKRAGSRASASSCRLTIRRRR